MNADGLCVDIITVNLPFKPLVSHEDDTEFVSSHGQSGILFFLISVGQVTLKITSYFHLKVIYYVNITICVE